jgi:hypothetical protein
LVHFEKKSKPLVNSWCRSAKCLTLRYNEHKPLNPLIFMRTIK